MSLPDLVASPYQVIRNGEMLAVRERRNRNTVSTGSMAAVQLAADVRKPVSSPAGEMSDVTMIKVDGPEPTYYFNDGGNGTGTREVGVVCVRMGWG